jgi:MYXO-CTERM domain-containing protein
MTLNARSHLVLIIYSAVASTATPSHAADYYVNVTTGNDTPPCGTVAAPCRTLKTAFTQFSPGPSLGDPAVVHVAPGIYYENAAPSAPQTGFSVPNHTHLISDQGADQTVLQVDLSNLALAGIVYVVRSQEIGLGQNATNITVDGFTITVPGGEVDLQMHQVVGINLGASLSTTIAPTGNVIRNNVIALRNKDGRTGMSREGAGVFAAGGVSIECNVFRLIDSVGIAMSSVESDGGFNATQPAQITRNWFYQFSNSVNLTPVSDDEYIAIGVNVPTTVRGNLLDFTRSTLVDRRFGLVCWDCPNLVAQNNIFTGLNQQNDAPIALVSQTPSLGPFTPLISFNSVADSIDGLQAFDGDQQDAGGDNFSPTFTDNIFWVTEAVRDFGAGTYNYNNWQGTTLPTGTGNISSDPLYQNVNARDFRLGSSSPSLTAAQGGGQQGAYGGTTPFGAPGAPTLPCVLRGATAGYPDLGQCTGQADGMACGTIQCSGTTHSFRGHCFRGLCDESERILVSCDDGNAGTVDSCVSGTGCVNTTSGMDAGTADSGQPADAGAVDGGANDGGTSADAGAEPDAGEMDGGVIPLPDGGVVLGDGGVVMPPDGGTPQGTLVVGVCGCSSTNAPLWALAAVGLGLIRRRGHGTKRLFR